MLIIFKKELQTFFGSLTAYIIIGFFLILLGLWVWVLPDSNLFDSGYAELKPLFQVGPYVLMFLAPAITMGLFSEERKTGTLELLLTSPLTPLQIIAGKFLASFTIVCIAFLLTMPYCIALHYLASPKGNVDWGALGGCYTGLLWVAASFLSIGLWISALTSSQVVAFLISTLTCFLLYQGFDAWATLQTWHQASLWIARWGMVYHYESISRGVLDIRDLTYFISCSSAALVLTYHSLQRR
jgi:ABC-2 type transport system permease protein